MANLTINNGAFTSAGNFSGYTAKGKRVHIYKRQMEALGWSTDKDVQFPFFCIAEIKQIQSVDEAGKPVGDPSDRLTALSVFKERENLIEAHKEDALLDIEIKQAITEQATEVGLSKEAIDALLSVAI